MSKETTNKGLNTQMRPKWFDIIQAINLFPCVS